MVHIVHDRCQHQSKQLQLGDVLLQAIAENHRRHGLHHVGRVRGAVVGVAAVVGGLNRLRDGCDGERQGWEG